MGIRMRRATLNVGGAITGVRDVEIDDQSEWNNDKGDANMSGKFVRMTNGPYSFRCQLLAPSASIVTKYVASAIVTGKIIDVTNGVESSADETITLTDGYINVGRSYPTDNPGRVPVEGSFQTQVIS